MAKVSSSIYPDVVASLPDGHVVVVADDCDIQWNDGHCRALWRCWVSETETRWLDAVLLIPLGELEPVSFEDALNELRSIARSVDGLIAKLEERVK